MGFCRLYFYVLLILFISMVFEVHGQDEPAADAAAPADGAAAGGAEGGLKCVKCKSFDECSNNLNDTMDCATEKLSTLGLAGEEQALWDKLKEKMDDPATYKACITVQWDSKAEFRGCGPDKVGEEDVCAYIKTLKDTVLCVNCTTAGCNNETLGGKAGGASGAPVTAILDFTNYFLLLSPILLKFVL